jgi:hypothetical protein
MTRCEGASRFEGLEIDTCPFANLPERSEPVGFDQGRDEKLRVAKTRVGRTDRVHRMDAGWSLEAFELCGLREDKEAQSVTRESRYTSRHVEKN